MADSVFTDTPAGQAPPATPTPAPTVNADGSAFTFDDESMAAFAATDESTGQEEAGASGDGQVGEAPAPAASETTATEDTEASVAEAVTPESPEEPLADEPTQEDIDEWTALTAENERLKAQQTELSALQELMQHPTFAQYAQKAIAEIAAGSSAIPGTAPQNGQQAPMPSAQPAQQPKLEKRPVPDMPEDVYDAEAMKRYHADYAAAVAHNTRVEMQSEFAPQFQTLATIQEQQAQNERVQRMASDFARAGASREEALALAQSDPATLVKLVVEGRKAQSRSGEKKVPAPPSLPKVPPRRTKKESAAGKVPPSGVAASGSPQKAAGEEMFTVTETKPSVFPV